MNKKITLDRYLNKLAASIPVPGGGSAAALVGAIGMSLLSMAAGFMAKKSGTETSSAKISKISKFAKHSQRRLKDLMDKDEKAYLQLSRALKGKTKNGIKRLYRTAAGVPVEMCNILYEGIKKCERLLLYCKTSLISDIAEAAVLMEAGFLSAKFNVEVNLGGTKDHVYSRKTRRYLLRQEKRIEKLKKRILGKIKWQQL